MGSTSDAKKAKMGDVEQNELAQDDSDPSAKVLDAIEALEKRLETKKEGIQTEVDVFRQEVNQNLEGVKVTIKGIEKSLEELWNRFEENSKDLNDQKAVSIRNWRTEAWINQQIQMLALFSLIDKK